jgi:hypothetical protein
MRIVCNNDNNKQSDLAVLYRKVATRLRSFVNSLSRLGTGPDSATLHSVKVFISTTTVREVGGLWTRGARRNT